MAKTVIGLFDRFGEAQSAVQDLVRFGVSREDISMVARDEHGTTGEHREVGAAEGAGAGAVGGSLVGGAMGLLIGTGLLVIPGIGPVLAAGPLAAAIGTASAAVGATALGAGLGAAAGGLLGGLMGAGIPEEDAQAYVEAVRRGGTLVSVNAADTEADDIRQILIRNGAIDMDSRSAEWRASGWDATGADRFAAGNLDAGPGNLDIGSDAYAAGAAARPLRDDSDNVTTYDPRDVGDRDRDPDAANYAADPDDRRVGRDADNRSQARADAGIPRGDSYSIAGRPYSADPDRAGIDTVGAQSGAETDAATEDWKDSSKAGTAGGAAAGAATGAAMGAAGGPVGAVIGGVAGAVTGAGVGAAGDVAGERADGDADAHDRRRAEGKGPGDYRFRDDENLAAADRKVVDTSYTDVDRTGERVKDPAGFDSGHTQPFDSDPAQFGEFAGYTEENYRSEEDLRRGPRASTSPSRDPERGGSLSGDDRPAVERSADRVDDQRPLASDADLLSESTRRAPHFGGADSMGGAVSGMRGGSGSEQPGAFSSTPGRKLSSDQVAAMAGDTSNAGERNSDQIRGGPRIYDQPEGNLDTARAGHPEAIPAHGDFARGMRDEPAPAVEPDYARGMHQGGHEVPGAPHHGDFARGMRDEEVSAREPDYARGQRGYEQYDADFLSHYQTLTGAGGQPYDYYKPGYQFGYDLANDRSYSHDSWDHAERDARQRWEREARGSWEEFEQTIRYGWEKARGRA